MTMDILWAISHSANSNLSNPITSQSFPGSFSVSTPPYADGTREIYEDFVGGVQFWGYGLVSGSGDGAVRMWDSKCTPLVSWEGANIYECNFSAYWASP